MAGPPEIIDLDSSSDNDSIHATGFRTSMPDHLSSIDSFDVESFQGSVRSDNMLHSQQPTFDACLKEILELFPDVSHEHARGLYDRWINNPGPRQNVVQDLIEQILDGGRYPKERERLRELKELKRKREDKNSDDEEAERWKFADIRDDPLEYAKVA